jgi:hypothetical protein
MITITNCSMTIHSSWIIATIVNAFNTINTRTIISKSIVDVVVIIGTMTTTGW